MHLALIATAYYPRLRGGAEHSLHHHAESLARLGFRVSVLSLHDGAAPERFRHNGVDCHALPVRNVKACLDLKNRAPAAARALWHVLDVYNPVAGRVLERELRALQPDLVQTETLPGWSCSAWNVIRRLGLPHVQMLHDYQLTCPVATRFRAGQNCAGTCGTCAPFATFRRRLSQHVEHAVANSHYTRQLHRDHGFFRRAKSFEVIYGAVPPPRVLSGAPANPQLLRVGYIGRLNPTKGIEVLIDAFIASGRRDAVLRIAGTGLDSYTEQLRARARGQPIFFLGHTPTDAFFLSIDVLVVPSLWHEPMGRVVLEAAAHGIPVIGASRGGIPELIDPARTGWLFDPSHPAELTALLARLDSSATRAMRDDCLAFARQFSPDAIAEKWLRLYERIAAQPAGAAASLVSTPPPLVTASSR